MTPRLPYALQKRGGQLLHQQCWFWGQDIRRKEGNVLLEHGFERVRPPQGVDGSSQYTLRLDATLQVRLWGFGFFYGHATGIYLNRYAFTPLRATLQGDVWTPKTFMRLPRSEDFAATAEAIRWIIRYEEAVLRRLGADYRLRCLSCWTNRGFPPLEFLSAWERLAIGIEDFASRTAMREKCITDHSSSAGKTNFRSELRNITFKKRHVDAFS